MAVKIRLRRMGKKKQPSYRVVVADSRSPRDGRIIENIGRYDPREDPSLVEIDSERAVYWLGVGAQPTERVLKLLEISGAMARFKAARGEVYVVPDRTTLSPQLAEELPEDPPAGPPAASPEEPADEPADEPTAALADDSEPADEAAPAAEASPPETDAEPSSSDADEATPSDADPSEPDGTEDAGGAPDEPAEQEETT